MKGIKGWVGACMALVLTACGGGSVQSPDFTPELRSLQVTPAAFSIATGDTQQLTAVGTYTTPPGSGTATTVRDVTKEVTWSSSSTGVATVDGEGLATGTGAGTSTITASLDGKTATSVATGRGVVLKAITVTQPSPVLPGGTASFTAQGLYSDSDTPRDITTVVNWTLDPAALGSFNVTTGKTVNITAGAATGTGVVTASTTDNGQTISGTANFIVAQLISLAVNPATATQPIGLAQEFTAVGTFAPQTGSSQTFEAPVAATWTATAAAGVTPPTLDAACEAGAVSETCRVTGRAEGQVTVKATANSISGTAVLTVGPEQLVALQITPDDVNTPTRTTPDKIDNLPLGAQQNLYALYYYSGNPSEPLVAPKTSADAVVWTSSATNVVALTPATNGNIVATGAAQGTADVVATVRDIKDTLPVTVTQATLTGGLVTVRPAQAFVAVKQSVEFTAVGKYSDGVERDVPDSEVNWTSSSDTIASIDANGVATAGDTVSSAGVDITATLKVPPSAGNASASAKLYVTSDGCTTPLLQSQGATTLTPAPVGICLTCGVDNANAAIDGDAATFAGLKVPVGLLNAQQSLDVNASATAPYTVPFAAGSRAGFVIGRPTGTLVLAEVATQVQISTLRNGAVQESSSTLTPLRVDLLGTQLLFGPGEDLALVSMNTTVPYDGVRVTLVSGVASALNGINVFGACGTVEPPAVAASGISELKTSSNTLTTGNTLGIVAYDFNNVDALLNSANIDWSSSDESVATVSDTGVVTGVAPGTVDIIATLRDTSACGTNCSRKVTLTVTAAYCATPLRAPEVTVSRDIAGLCLFCTVENLANVIDASDATYANAYLPVALLGGLGSVSVTVKSASDQPAPLPAGQVGFLVSQPSNAVAVAEVLSQFQVSTLDANGAVIESSSGLPSLLRLDLLGLNLLGSRQGVISFPATKPYKALRLTFSPGVAGLLTQVNVNSACGAVAP